jgi:hypothetical protein
MKIYLASPIDQNGYAKQTSTNASAEVWTRWPESIPLVIYQPVQAFDLKHPNRRELQYLVDLNETALHTADALLVIYQKLVPTWGVPQELLLAQRWEIPIFVMLTDQLKPAELPTYLRVRVQDEHLYVSWDNLVRDLLEYEP